MVNDRSVGSDAFNLPGQGRSIGAKDFAVALGNTNNAGSDPQEFYRKQMQQLQQVDSKATLDFQLSQSADVMKQSMG